MYTVYSIHIYIYYIHRIIYIHVHTHTYVCMCVLYMDIMMYLNMCGLCAWNSSIHSLIKLFHFHVLLLVCGLSIIYITHSLGTFRTLPAMLLGYLANASTHRQKSAYHWMPPSSWHHWGLITWELHGIYHL